MDRSEGLRLRDVVIAPKKRPRARAAFAMAAALGLFVIAAQYFVQASFHGVVAGILSLAGAALVTAAVANTMFGREQVVIESGGLSRRQGVGSLSLETKLPLAAIQGISVQPEEPWTRDPDGPGAAVEIALVQFGDRERTPWRIAAGVDWTRAELDWLAEYLETGVALARRSVT
ncbi:MAG TPA: hypothetical protein VNO33_11645 [Kofleriaceae bacterium]|nr:hypothetical protein [Kofleriaceae bacterium]